MLKRIIFDVDEGDEKWIARLLAAGFSKLDVDAIYVYVCDHASV
jgi:hypothetical protein